MVGAAAGLARGESSARTRASSSGSSIRLGHVIVRAQIESAHAVGQSVAGSQYISTGMVEALAPHRRRLSTSKPSSFGQSDDRVSRQIIGLLGCQRVIGGHAVIDGVIDGIFTLTLLACA